MRTERQLKALKKWMIDLGMTQRQIGKECGVTQGLVSQVIYGKRKNQKVIDFFLSRGCPRELLN
jgi:predicted transcriptional regulator